MYRSSHDDGRSNYFSHQAGARGGLERPRTHADDGRQGPSPGRPALDSDELDEIQQEFEALTRWTREAEQARSASLQQAGRPLPATAYDDHPVASVEARSTSSPAARHWRDILGGPHQHRRVDSDASVDDMDFATYTRQLQQGSLPAVSSRPSCPGALSARPSFASHPSAATPISPAPSYTSRFPPDGSSPSIRSGASYQTTAPPRDDYELPAPFSHAPQEAFHPELFDARAGHHHSPAAGEDARPTQHALKGFPSFSRKWFRGDAGGSYRGVGDEKWESGFTGDLADGLDPSAAAKAAAASDATKHARIKRLEREFGPETAPEGGRDSSRAEFMEGQPPRVGDLDKKGRIVTAGPRKRSALRWIECLLSLLTLVLLIYSALVLKNLGPMPPPQSTLPAYALYAWSSVALVAVVVLHAIYPLACHPRDRKRLAQQAQHPSGGMILPMAHPPGGKHKKGRRGQPAPMAINLVVDPRFLTPASSARPKKDRRRHRRRRDSLSSSSSSSSDEGEEAKFNPRSSFSDVLAQRQQFSVARRWLVKLACFDAVLGIGWAGVFGFALTAPTCAPGTSGGWCDCWNSALAFAALLALSFLTSLFFGLRDRKIQLLLHTH